MTTPRSKYRHVYWHKWAKKWAVRLHVRGHSSGHDYLDIGYYEDEATAGWVADIATEALVGPNQERNFPKSNSASLNVARLRILLYLTDRKFITESQLDEILTHQYKNPLQSPPTT